MTGKQSVALQALAQHSKEQAGQIPNAIENVLVKQLEQYGRCFSTLKQDVQVASLQHAQAMQQVVRTPLANRVGTGRLPQ